MGCVNSHPKALPRQISRNPQPLTDLEIRDRIDAPSQSQTVEIGGVRYKYAWISQRGYYPDCEWCCVLAIASLSNLLICYVAPSKDNQDAFAIDSSFGGPNQAFFGVFDGHGKEGHHCARFVRDNVRATYNWFSHTYYSDSSPAD